MAVYHVHSSSSRGHFTPLCLITPRYTSSHCITQHHIAPHHVAVYHQFVPHCPRVTSQHYASSLCITSRRVTPHHTASDHTILRLFIQYHLIPHSFNTKSYCPATFHVTLHQTTSPACMTEWTAGGSALGALRHWRSAAGTPVSATCRSG